MKKLNIGCGDELLVGYTNCDAYPVDDSVIETDVLSLRGLRTSEYGEVRIHMVLEHVHVDLVGTALHQISRVLTPDGVVMITVPDMDYFIDLYLNHAKGKLHTTKGVMAFKEACYQLLDPELDPNLQTHQCFFNFDFLKMSLLQEGFVGITRQESQDGTLVVHASKEQNISTFKSEV